MRFNMAIEPLHDFIVVKIIDDPNNTTKGGLFIPETANVDNKQVAVIVSVGPGLDGAAGRMPKDFVKSGDIVILQKYIGTEIDIDGVKHYLIKWLDVQAKLIYTDDQGNVYNPEKE